MNKRQHSNWNIWRKSFEGKILIQSIWKSSSWFPIKMCKRPSLGLHGMYLKGNAIATKLKNLFFLILNFCVNFLLCHYLTDAMWHASLPERPRMWRAKWSRLWGPPRLLVMIQRQNKNIARIANAVHCHTLLSGHEFRFSIVRIVISVLIVIGL